MRRCVLAAVFSLAVLSAQQLLAQNQPVGTYQEIFVTRDGTTATDTSISTYNNFVAAEAALNPALPAGVTWTAVASTGSNAANLNAPSGSYPVYNTGGHLVSIGNSIYSGSLQNPVGFDQLGATNVSAPWTGSNADGTLNAGFPLGSPIYVGVGDSTSSTATWLNATFGVANAVSQRSLYALSSPISSTVAGGGSSVVGGVQATVAGTAIGTLSSSFVATTDPVASEALIGSAAFAAINFSLPAYPPHPAMPVYQAWELTPTTAFPPVPCIVTVHFDASMILPSQISELTVMHYMNGTWQFPPVPCVVNATADTMTFTTTRFSPFMLAVVPEPSTWSLLAMGTTAWAAAAMRSRLRRTA